jgi:hypothetical protein
MQATSEAIFDQIEAIRERRERRGAFQRQGHFISLIRNLIVVDFVPVKASKM